MRPLTALAALLLLEVCRAHQPQPDPIRDTLHNLLGEHYKPVQKLLTCSRSLGPTKCFSALSAWRAERAIDAYSKEPNARFNLTEDVEQFPWTEYTNASDEQLYNQLSDDTQKLLQYRPMRFNMIPGYEVKLNAKADGKMNVKVYKRDEIATETGRGSMKKLLKSFYRFAPLLLLPGLLMAVVFPFILPGLKMMTLFVMMINNMSLMGAIFTLLRNNAFNDKYTHKIVYVNKGYDNEKHRVASSNNEEHFHTDHLGTFYDDSQKIFKHGMDQSFAGDDFDNIEELRPFNVNPDWVKEYTDGKMMEYLAQNQRIGSNNELNQPF